MYFNDNANNGRNPGCFPGTGGLLGQITNILDQLGGLAHGPVGRPASLTSVPPIGNVPAVGGDGQATFRPLPGQPGYDPDPGFHRDPSNPSNPDPGFAVGPGDDRYTPSTGVPLLPFGENGPGTAIRCRNTIRTTPPLPAPAPNASPAAPGTIRNTGLESPGGRQRKAVP